MENLKSILEATLLYEEAELFNKSMQLLLNDTDDAKLSFKISETIVGTIQVVLNLVTKINAENQIYKKLNGTDKCIFYEFDNYIPEENTDVFIISEDNSIGIGRYFSNGQWHLYFGDNILHKPKFVGVPLNF